MGKLAPLANAIVRMLHWLFTQSMSPNLHPMLNVAVKAARAAGAIINRAALDLEALRVSQKQVNDFVTEADHASEQVIIETLLTAYPGHGILAEESGQQHGAKDSECVWIIDPLDGTTNFIHGLPTYCVSIALAVRGKVEQAVVYDPTRNDLFTATKGRGTTIAGQNAQILEQREVLGRLLSAETLAGDASTLEQKSKSLDIGKLTLKGGSDPLRTAELQTTLTKIVATLGLRLKSTRALPARDAEGVRLIGVQAQFQASLAQLQKILLAIEESDAILTIEALRIVAAAGATDPKTEAPLDVNIDVFGATGTVKG